MSKNDAAMPFELSHFPDFRGQNGKILSAQAPVYISRKR